tara:strand:- start:2111 stop:2608 length:498 start_codon:yes stop_codon:yes gene_type:complete
MNNVTNDEFKEAFKNLDNIRIMNKVCSKYRATIPYEEIERCKMIALWQALKAFDPNGGRKFTSFLYNRIDWECKKQIYEINKSRRIKIDMPLEFSNASTPDDFLELLEIKDVMEKIDKNSQKIIYQRFFQRMTMKEIAKENGYSRETARRNIICSIDKIKKCLQN